MTVCIAAISDNNDIVCVTDKKYTVNHVLTSVFEITENKKSIELTPNCVALFSGDVTHANAVLKLAKASIIDADDVETVAKKIQAAYNQRLKEEINQQLLQKHGLDIDSFNAQQRTLDTTFVKTIIDTVTQNGNLGIEIVVAGKNAGIPQLIKMQVSGTLEDDTYAGYVCIGSGGSHAKLSMVESKCHAGLPADAVIYATIQAKKKAEFDANVGKLTAMALITDEIRFVDDISMDKILEEYAKAEDSISGIATKSSSIMKRLAYADTK